MVRATACFLDVNAPGFHARIFIGLHALFHGRVGKPSAGVAVVELGLGMGGISLIGTNLACLACLIWVVRRARSRTRARGIKNSLADGWSHTGLTRLLGIAVRLFLPADVRWIKWEEWCAELACIDSRWEKTVYLLDLLGKMRRMARVAREGRNKGRP